MLTTTSTPQTIQNTLKLFSNIHTDREVVMSRDRRRVGSVKAAINLYGETILKGNSALKKPQTHFSEKPNSRTRELNLQRIDMGRFIESKRVAESAKAQVESELLNAKKTVRDLTSRIEESNLNAKAQLRELEKLNIKNYQYEEVIRELENLKLEFIKLKLDMGSVLEEKREAEKETRASRSKIESCSSSVESLRKEIDEVNEEQVLVELARIEALKEFGAIEAHRKEEFNHFSFAMVETRNKIDNMVQELDCERDREMKLAITISDVNVVQRKLNLVKEISFRKGDESESESSPLLQSMREEFEAARKELNSIREEGFEFMSTMDIIRSELKHVSEEIARLKNTEKEDLTVRKLNMKLVRAKAKLETVSEAGEKAKSIVSNLSISLKQVKSEAEVAKKERELISADVANIEAEVKKTESKIDLAEERLEAAMKELDGVQSSEAKALENLKGVIDSTRRARSLASQNSPTIRISTFEYEYLKGHASRAEEIADKKVAAAQAWLEALKASEKEILMKTEIANREIREREALSAKRETDIELQYLRQKREKNLEAKNLKLDATPRRKFMNRSGNSTPRRRAELRKSVSPASFTAKRRRKVNLAKLFNAKRTDRDL